MLIAIAFYLFAAVTVASAVMVVASRNPVHSVLFLILAFFSAAGIFMIAGAEFLAMILVVVYVGAVAVLFLFVVMMLDINLERMRQGFWNNLIPGLVVGGLMLAEMVMVLGAKYFGPESAPNPPSPEAGYSNTKELGRLIYTDYVYPFELAAVILVVAIIAAIALTMRRRQDTKWTDPASQVAIKRNDRIRMVSMPTEKD